jgi:signal-transduction protein with cAMP-binding, CBS, and nucleotidyltransferase domain
VVMADESNEPLEVTLERIDSKFGRKYNKGNYIFNQGEFGDRMFIIRKGKVKISQTINNIEVNSYIMHTGDIFGEMSIIDPKPRYGSAIALEDSFILSLSRDEFIYVVRRNPSFSIKIMQNLAKIIRSIDEELDIFRTGNRQLIVINKINRLFKVKSEELKIKVNITYNTKDLISSVMKSTNSEGQYIRNVLEQLNMKNILHWSEVEVKVKDFDKLIKYEQKLKEREGLQI